MNDSFNYTITPITEENGLAEKAASWFSSKWGIPKKKYLDSMKMSFECGSPVPAWYLCISGDEIIGGMGVIENDFHDRPDLTPNICAVYTEKAYRGKGIAGKMLEYVCGDMCEKDIDTLYLITDHVGFYERYGWKFYGMVRSGEHDTRMYIRKASKEG
ncbi:MAG: GNAT family N-acetyltransferase [Huintestinicola sp.]